MLPEQAAGSPAEPVAARGHVNGRGPRHQAWEGWSAAEGLQGTLTAGSRCTDKKEDNHRVTLSRKLVILKLSSAS
ncbi:MAG: hypothetical protein IK145_09950 [Bacteroidales bacterium]|nr:hypothetical protein [Bacteroidales bacterium]